MGDFRALCAELVEKLDELNCHFNIPSQSAIIERVHAALAEPGPAPAADGEAVELPPRPPLMEPPAHPALERYGITWDGSPDKPLLTRRADGYWTPWHVAADPLERQVLRPIPVSERLPGPEDCAPHPRTKRGNWCWGFERCEVSLARPARWRLMHMETVEMEASHWLSGHALPLPEVE